MIRIIASIVVITIVNMTIYKKGRYDATAEISKKFEEYFEELKKEDKEWK